jgi:beta-lactamase class A
VQIAVAVEDAIASGAVDGREQRRLAPAARTPGPVGMSLMHDEVRMSVRDLVSLMLTISDNVATDELIATVGLDAINAVTDRLRLGHTRIVSDLATLLDEVARDCGFADYRALAAHDPHEIGAASDEEIERRIAASTPLDPRRGTRTTAAETVRLLQAIWDDVAAPPDACATVRQLMARQLTRHRIASGFPDGISVAAKSGALLGLIRNEVGVVTFPDGQAFAVAVFTRRDPGRRISPSAVDAAIGTIAAALVAEFRS